MYDWANSAYITTVATGILPAYFAGEVVGPEGIKIGNNCLIGAGTIIKKDLPDNEIIK